MTYAKKSTKHIVLGNGLIYRMVFRIFHKFKKKCSEVRKVLFWKLSFYSCIKLAMDLGWWSRRMWRDGVEFQFFLLNIGVLCEGGSTRGLDSWTWSKTCQYFALSDDAVCRSKPWDSILTYPKRFQASRRSRKSSKSSELLIIFSLLREHAFLLP